MVDEGSDMSSAVGRKSPLIVDAERRMITALGMPFPIVERPHFDPATEFAGMLPEQKKVPLSLLIATQRDFDPNHVQSLMGADDLDPIDVVRDAGKYYIVDGHHRAAAAKFRGDQVVPANVVE